MNKFALFLAVFILVIGETASQIKTPVIEWEKSIGGTKSEFINSVYQTKDGGYVLAGYTFSNDGNVSRMYGKRDCWVVKISNRGDIEWESTYGGSEADEAFSIEQTSDGGYIMGATTESSDGDVTDYMGNLDLWIVKLTSDGQIQWQKTLGGSWTERDCVVRQTKDGGYIVAGSSSSTDYYVSHNHGSFDYWVVKLDSKGKIIWEKTYGGLESERAKDIHQTTDGGYIVGGYSVSISGDVTGNHGDYDYWIIKIDESGTLEWEKSLGGNAQDYALSVIQTYEGGYAAAGYTYSSNNGDVKHNHGKIDCWIVKLNSKGDIEWDQMLGGSGYDQCKSISQTEDRGYIIAGSSDSSDGDIAEKTGSLDDSWAVKLDSSGNFLWQKVMGGSFADGAAYIQQTEDRGYIVAGYSSSSDGDVSQNIGGADYWVIKLSKEMILGTEDKMIKNKKLQVYPNPVIDYVFLVLPDEEKINSVFVTDLSGRIFRPDITENRINVSGLSSGLYVLKIETNTQVYTEKIIKR